MFDPQFDVVYMLGDIPTHHAWNQSEEEHLQVMRVFFDMVSTYLPNARIYPTLGTLQSYI